MILIWEGETALADADMLAILYEVSTRTVRRHCRPVRYEPRPGRPRGHGGRALYDAVAAADALTGVAARPERTLAALRSRTGIGWNKPTPPPDLNHHPG